MNTENIAKHFKSWKNIVTDNQVLYRELFNVLSELRNLYKQGEVFPSPTQIFRAFQEVDIKECKYVLLGMDPYHNLYRGVPSACGLSFVTENGYTNPSLRILLKCLNLNTPNQFYNLMIKDKKVLMLNAALTVSKGLPGSHSELWSRAMEILITVISKKVPTLKWVLLGRDAQSYRQYIIDGVVHTAPHPASYIYRKGASTKELDILFKELNWVK